MGVCTLPSHVTSQHGTCYMCLCTFYGTRLQGPPNQGACGHAKCNKVKTRKAVVQQQNMLHSCTHKEAVWYQVQGDNCRQGLTGAHVTLQAHTRGHNPRAAGKSRCRTGQADASSKTGLLQCVVLYIK
jgi:hypothetical protein